MTIRLLVADDEQVIRAGVAAMLVGTEVEVAYQVCSGEEAVKCTALCRPDVVLLDLRMPGMDGLQALQHIKEQRPEIPVLVFSGAENIAEIAKAYRLGASGFLTKDTSRPALLQAIRCAASRRGAWPRTLLRRVHLMTPFRDGAAVGGVWLTARQQQILRKLALGLSSEEISEELGISVETLRQHMKQILLKTGCVDRTQAALWAIRMGLGPTPSPPTGPHVAHRTIGKPDNHKAATSGEVQQPASFCQATGGLCARPREQPPCDLSPRASEECS